MERLIPLLFRDCLLSRDEFSLFQNSRVGEELFFFAKFYGHSADSFVHLYYNARAVFPVGKEHPFMNARIRSGWGGSAFFFQTAGNTVVYRWGGKGFFLYRASHGILLGTSHHFVVFPVQDGSVQPHVFLRVAIDTRINKTGIFIPFELVHGIIHQGLIKDVQADEQFKIFFRKPGYFPEQMRLQLGNHILQTVFPEV